MRYLAIILSCCLLLPSCATLSEIQQTETAQSVGSFELCPVRPNSYWYTGTSYEYNEYEIEVVSEPCGARVQWNGRNIGTTPFLFKYTGAIDKNERIVVHATPLDSTFNAQSATLKMRQELPRKIAFDFRQSP